jgi:hypothetical protein
LRLYNRDLPRENISNEKIRAQADLLSMMFTRPRFPGGDEAWERYIKKFCADNSETFKDLGTGTISVQFIVDNNGVLYEVKAFTNAGTKLARFAEEAVRNSPILIPAVQNGPKVICYQKVVVRL